jgi:hypothetical protein
MKSFYDSLQSANASSRPAFRSICLLALLALLSSGASGKIDNGIYGPVQKRWRFDVSIVSISPQSTTEFKPIEVKFTVVPSIFGVAGDVPPPPQFQVCPDRQDSGAGTTCSRRIVNYSAGQTISGSLTALAPMADVSPSVRILVITDQIPRGGEFPIRAAVAETAHPYTTSAAYMVRLDGFDVLTSRSAVEDTVWASMLGLVKIKPPLSPHPSDSESACRIANEHFCRSPDRIGSYSSGSVATPRVQIGTFELTPNKEDDLRFTIALTNIGDDTWVQELGNSIANGFSMAGMVALSTTAYGGAGEGLHKGMEEFHGKAFAGCDGPLVEAMYIVPNKPLTSNSETLYGITMATGSRSFRPEEIFVSNDDDVRCGDDGKYRVRYSILRTSWRHIPAEF